MNELQSAIEGITYRSRVFPQKEFEIIAANRDEAIPYLRSAIEKVLMEGIPEDDEYELPFYALFLLAELRDREFFPKIVEFISLPDDVLDDLVGDTITEGMKEVLYYTYNGDIELLKQVVEDETVNEYVRAEALYVMGQLYLDGDLGEAEWKEFIKKNIYAAEDYNFVNNGLATVICRCHFVDMLPEIRYMLEHELMEEMCMGEYDSCVDEMFQYKDDEKNFCELEWHAADHLRNWSMFDNTSKKTPKKNDFDKLVRNVMREEQKSSSRKIGRNDPCPCGSGKKYKHCCLNKPVSPIDKIESLQERQKALINYPYTGKEKQEGRIYLDDYFDQESIEIDKLLYLGLMQRPGWIWLRNEEAEQKRCLEYLKLAFGMFEDRAEREGIRTFAEYDERFSIHYFCSEWMEKLLELSEMYGDQTVHADVKKCMERMNSR